MLSVSLIITVQQFLFWKADPIQETAINPLSDD